MAGPTRFSKRYIARGTWTSASAIHLGAGTHASLGETDMRLVRDRAGSFFIPAASLAGAGRSWVATRAPRSLAKDEPEAVKLLFGVGEGYASLLSIDDAGMEDPVTPTIRDGVRIDEHTGLAFDDGEGGAKYDIEVLPAGAEFHFRFELRVPDVIPAEVTEDELLGHFRLLLTGFSEGAIRLGARTRRGYGAGRVMNWTIDRYELTEPAGFIAWLKRSPGAKVKLADLGSAIERSSAQRLEIEVWLRLKTSLMVRSGGSNAKDPDAVHLTEGKNSVLPGTGLAGVLRQRCLQIANTVAPHKAALVDGMFGPLKKTGERTELRASRVWTSDAVLHDGRLEVHTRVAIDRFTQGALESALFDEAPFWPSKTSDGHVRALRIWLEAPRESETTRFEDESGLLLMAFKDLWLGDLTLGGESSVGRGVFTGIRARFTGPGFDGLELKSGSQEDPADVVREGNGWEILERWCAEWKR
jgi:CRISPR/Cas system CSM-associated protein Csm3 (group 7 of RAMP superfamily)